MAQLGDILAGAGGSPVNRPALNAYVAQGQALAGLRTAQTEDAMANAQRMREEQQASDDLEGALLGAKDAQGHSMFTPSEAHFTATQMKFLHGGALPALQAWRQAQGINQSSTVADPNADPNARLAAAQAQQVAAGKPAQGGFTQDQGQLVGTFGPTAATEPSVLQTPASLATENLHNAQAELASRHATNPQAFNPNAMTPEEIAAVVDYVKKNPNAAPTGYSLTRPTGAHIAAALDQAGGASAPAPKGGTLPAPPPNETTHPGPAPLPNVSYAEQAAIRKDFASGTAAKQTTSLNTMYLHSQLFDRIADQLGNGNTVPTNQINVLWQHLFGGPAPSNLNTAAQFLGREAVRATVNSGSGTGEERELQVGPNASPAQLHGVAETLRSLAGGQLQSLERRAARGGVDITQLLDPQVVAGYGRVNAGGGNNVVAPGGGAAPPVNLLKEGFVTHFANGQSWALRNGVPVQVNGQ